jgi:4'-phosphopantetheinyl transferase EntD
MDPETSMSLALDELFGESVVTAQVWLGAEGPLDPLYPEELVPFGSARPERLHEFRAGRHAAREALSRLGIPPGPIARNEDRSPCWPAGVAGSITHVRRGSWGFAAAAVARRETWAAIGIDVELDTALEEPLWRRVLTPSERRRLEGLPEAERGALAKLVFSAKEAVYKCQYTVTQTFLEFSDVEIDWSADAFLGRVLKHPEAARVGTALAGRYLRAAGLLVTATALPGRR